MFLDTSGLFCYQSVSEPECQLATRLFETPRPKLTHSYVLSEYLALITTRRLNRAIALDFLSDMMESSLVEIVWVDKVLHEKAMDLLKARRDKTYSLCDAVSFVLMSERSVYDALTTDRHFEQEGFRKLL